ncbi:Sps1 protein [Candida orthopsilosis Co 90-125]|uniref:non-specific serine/threonine protein kinase n=1 Tax=Candida orthopsilosis (strain 90-125) TaxID=1136231 RepID=H8X0I5_CANO9|nr:Sps1 protein [Candida orthopsilosis Co 90-125]CCG22697.1 Sps1 protein [Candida orthopsilosis Co 90-125]
MVGYMSSRRDSKQISSPQSSCKYGNLRIIGRGNFGDVYRATNLTARKIEFVAIKVINMDDSGDDIKQTVREIQFLNKLRHANVVKYYESFTHGVNVFIVMEYCGGGSCSDLIKFQKKIPENVVGYIIKKVLIGLSYLHGEHKVHRDIKAANILLTDDGQVKIGDFGVSTEITLSKKKRNTFVGTPFWMAPEVITRGGSRRGVKKDDGYDYKADIWSTGITVIELVTGAPPLAEYDPMKVLFDIPKKKPPQLKGHYSDNIKEFVNLCVTSNPEQRPNCATLLQHGFITQLQGNIRQELMRMIIKKNAYIKQKPYSNSRHKLNCDLIENIDHEVSEIEVKPEIEWEFTQTLQMQLNNMTPDSSKVAETESGSVEVTGDDSVYSNVISLNVINSEVITPQQTEKGAILFHSLHHVLARGRDEETRRGVERVINAMNHFELKHPGLSNALVEEIERALRK